MTALAKIVIAITTLGGSSATIAGASGAFSNDGNTFIFQGSELGDVSFYCPLRAGKYAKPEAKRETQRIVCLYEGDNGPVTELRLRDKQDQDNLLEWKSYGTNIYSLKTSGKTFKLDKRKEGNQDEEYLQVTLNSQTG
ncbi:hypothetical protein MHLP_01865 [Candidatus Mycoplasma haematolamae str. Purdue]|uniref:Uncharacterized protein n=1 Tax=Mycoplasma haematolamae (strain Purdue) TaxID=1212765 RepID=I7BJE5_MYCHA|nr:hypothetical protein [Candidatus Mycoplasma haematolamae]AFO51953.1 hypothetical protein MHLP_01865 [Candidatus Mycoplasma haematolamae str. Purdue]